MKNPLRMMWAAAAALLSMPADDLGWKTEPPKEGVSGRMRHTPTRGAFGRSHGRNRRGIPLHENRSAWQALRRRSAW